MTFKLEVYGGMFVTASIIDDLFSFLELSLQACCHLLKVPDGQPAVLDRECCGSLKRAAGHFVLRVENDVHINIYSLIVLLLCNYYFEDK